MCEHYGERFCQEPLSLDFDKCWKCNTLYNGIKKVCASNSKLEKLGKIFYTFFQTFSNSLENSIVFGNFQYFFQIFQILVVSRQTAAKLLTAGPTIPDREIRLDLLGPAAFGSGPAGARRVTRIYPGWSGLMLVATSSRTGTGRDQPRLPL